MFFGVLVADIDCLDCLNRQLFFPLYEPYELIVFLIRKVPVLFNWLFLLLKLLQNSHWDSGGMFYVNGCI